MARKLIDKARTLGKRLRGGGRPPSMGGAVPVEVPRVAASAVRSLPA
jgi:hypothetical protein